MTVWIGTKLGILVRSEQNAKECVALAREEYREAKELCARRPDDPTLQELLAATHAAWVAARGTWAAAREAAREAAPVV